MNYETLLAPHRDTTVGAGLVGTGDFGASLIGQANACPQLTVPAACDLDVERGRAAFEAAGFAREDIEICESDAAAKRAMAAGRRVVVPDSALLMGLPLDIIVEATGHPSGAARTGTAAIAAGKHLAMVSKEAECVVGPALAARARAAGLVSTLVDGDQPSLLVGLLSWAATLGLRIAAAGKSSEYDFVWDPASGQARWQDRTVEASELRDVWTLPDGPVADTVARRAELLAAFPQRTVPDLCEMSIVCNATGLKPDRADFHMPIARTVEVPDILCPAGDGGLLADGGKIDVFNCLRRPDEASFAGGVFVVADCIDRASWQMLKSKGIPVSRDGKHGLLYNPSHLLGIEAPISILSACLLGLPTGAERPRQVVDLAARAAADLKAGTLLSYDHRHAMKGVDPLIVDAVKVGPGQPVPYYMAVGNRLAADAPAGTVLTADMIERLEGDELWHLRAEQDAT